MTVGPQIVLVARAVRAMAVNASKLHGGMDVFVIFQFIRLVGVAGKTEIVSSCKEHLGVRGAMGVVAYGTLAGCGRPVLKWAGHSFLVVAHEAEVLSLGSPQLELVRGLVGTVACRACAGLHRRMDMARRVHSLMALVAELRNRVWNRLEFVLRRLLMAEKAITSRNGAMDKLVSPKVAVALARYTALFSYSANTGRRRRPCP